MAIYTAGSLTKDGTPVNTRTFRSEASFARYKVKTESALGYWEKVPKERLSYWYQYDTVYLWKKYEE